MHIILRFSIYCHSSLSETTYHHCCPSDCKLFKQFCLFQVGSGLVSRASCLVQHLERSGYLIKIHLVSTYTWLPRTSILFRLPCLILTSVSSDLHKSDCFKLCMKSCHGEWCPQMTKLLAFSPWFSVCNSSTLGNAYRVSLTPHCRIQSVFFWINRQKQRPFS